MENGEELTTWSALALAPAISEQPLGDGLLVPEAGDEELVMSPLTAAVTRTRSEQRNVAIVRKVSLSRPPSARLERLTPNSARGSSRSSTPRPTPSTSSTPRPAASTSSTPRTAAGACANHGLPPQLPSGAAMQAREGRRRPPSGLPRQEASEGELPDYNEARHAEEDVMLRPLSREEVDEKTANAVSYFKESRAINARARSVEDIENALAQARQRRAARSASRERAVKEKPKAPDELEVATAAPKEEAKHRMSFRAAAETVATAVRKKTLAEKFGYGVVLKTVEPVKPAVEEPRVQETKPKQKSGFIGVEAGDNDLLQRLAAKRRNAAAASGA